MSSVTRRTRGDTGPPFISTIKDSNKTVVDLTGATQVRFHMNERLSELSVIDAAGALYDAPNGQVIYNIQVGDLDIEEGDYDQEWEITLSDGTVVTYPTNKKNTVKIGRQLA